MTNVELLRAYREKALRLRELQEQIARCGVTGAPSRRLTVRLTGLPRGTNEPVAAAMQLADGLEAMAKRQRAELNALWPAVLALTSRIDDVKLYMIVHHYYVLGQTIEEIAGCLYVSPRTVARMKRAYLDGLDSQSA